MSTVIFLPPSKQTWTGHCFTISLRSICAFFGGLCFYCHISDSLLCRYGIAKLPVFLSGHVLNLHLLCTFLRKTSAIFSGFKYGFGCYLSLGNIWLTFHKRKMVWLTQLTAKWLVANPHTFVSSFSKEKKSCFILSFWVKRNNIAWYFLKPDYFILNFVSVNFGVMRKNNRYPEHQPKSHIQEWYWYPAGLWYNGLTFSWTYKTQSEPFFLLVS
jgi:hypothetical protein